MPTIHKPLAHVKPCAFHMEQFLAILRSLGKRGHMIETASRPHVSRFTAANAREMARRAKESRERNKLAKLNAPPSLPLIATMPADQYLDGRIASARTEIDRLTKLATKERDPLNCERLARAIGQWSEIERVLAGRPLPGSKKPAEDRAQPTRPAPVEPL